MTRTDQAGNQQEANLVPGAYLVSPPGSPKTTELSGQSELTAAPQEAEFGPLSPRSPTPEASLKSSLKKSCVSKEKKKVRWATELVTYHTYVPDEPVTGPFSAPPPLPDRATRPNPRLEKMLSSKKTVIKPRCERTAYAANTSAEKFQQDPLRPTMRPLDAEARAKTTFYSPKHRSSDSSQSSLTGSPPKRHQKTRSPDLPHVPDPPRSGPPPTPRPARLPSPDIPDLEDRPFCDCNMANCGGGNVGYQPSKMEAQMNAAIEHMKKAGRDAQRGRK